MSLQKRIERIIANEIIPDKNASFWRYAPEYAAKQIAELITKRQSELYSEALEILSNQGYQMEAEEIAAKLDKEFALSVSMKNIATFFEGVMQTDDEAPYKHLRSFVEATFSISVKPHINDTL